MDDHLHRVLGLYPTLAAAERAREQLVQCGLAPARIKVLRPGRGGVAGDGVADSDDVLKEMLREGAIGTAVGTLAGAAGTVALAAANISLFIASPVVGTLSMLGWGASLGGLVGAVAGFQGSKGDVADLVREALARGQVVLVAHTATEAQTTQARQIIGGSMGETGGPAPTDFRPTVPTVP